ncbi:hypothetical protein [Streptomyces sp. rh34]|uniref:hypothetical protein n=1 Tax=Streptomyces sp. rh34 TaxID=2034272 RepID=UPI0015CF63A8|nr:hypothetical protein [Streptomyces sp. rh34]
MIRRGGAEVTILARELRDGWCLAIELEGTSGWVGMGRKVRAELSARGRVAVSAFQDPNQIMMQVAVDGTPLCELNLIAGYFTRGQEAEGAEVESLLAAGFSRDGGPVGQAAQLDLGRRAVPALVAVTGVELEEARFDGPWYAGLAAPVR